MRLFNYILDMWFAIYGETIDEYDIKKRLETCIKCDQIEENFTWGIITFKGKKQCKICKCDLHRKTRLKFERCPLNKWHK